MKTIIDKVVRGSNLRREVIESYLICFDTEKDVNELIERVEETYYGEYDSDEEFMQELIKQIADEIMLDYSKYNNHYFRNY